MIGILQSLMAVMAGVCLYAAAQHLSMGQRRPGMDPHRLFALLSFFVSLYVLAKLTAYHARSAEELVALRRLEVSLAVLLVGVLPWFVAAYTGVRTRGLLWLLSVLLGAVLVVNLVLPYGLGFVELPPFQQQTLPWGEQIVDLRVRQRSAWYLVAFSVLLLVFAYTGYACVRQYRHGDRRRAVWLALALAVLLAFVLLNQAVNFRLVNFVHTAEFGFIALVLLMSVGLSRELRTNRDALLASEARFRVLVEQAADAIFLHDVEGRIIDVNQQACTGLGYSRDELLRMTVADIEAEVSPERARALWAVMRPGIPVTVEGRHRRRDGSVFPVEVRVGLFRAGNRDLALAIARDISARKQAEAALQTSEERLRATLDNTPGVAVQWFDRGGRVLYWNTASERLYAIPAAQALGRTLAELLHTPEQFREFLAVIAEIEQHGTAYGPAEIDMYSLQGAAVSVLYTMFMIPGSGSEPIFVCMDVDITERKRAEAELRRYREHLEELVAARTAALAAANRELESFSYSVSHDLRAPLRAVDGFAQALVEEYGPVLDDTARDYVRRVRSGTHRMSVLIEDLLQLSRIGRSALRPETVDLSAMVSEIVADLRAAAPDRAVDARIASGLRAHGDPQLLHVLLTNLLDNAWKYTARAVEPWVEFGTTSRAGETAYYVRDNGVGFDMQFADKLFGAFQRLHGGEFQGTGIGLATVQRIIHRHGGRVWAESEPGKGAAFYFVLPMPPPAAAAEGTEPGRAGYGTHRVSG